MSAQIKQIIIAIVIILVAFFAFKTFFGNETPNDQSLISQSSESSYLAGGEEILVLLGKLNAIQLDSSIFSNRVFMSLTSFERPLEEQITGRPNPFLPIGRDSVSRVSTTSESIVKME